MVPSLPQHQQQPSCHHHHQQQGEEPCHYPQHHLLQQQKTINDKQSTVNSKTTTATTAPDYEPWSEANLQDVIALWKLSAKDEGRLRTLQRRVADVPHTWNDPHVLLRYMFAPHGYSKAEQHFREMIAWRLQHKVDTILEDYTPHPVLLDYASPLVFLDHCDRDGDPIYLERGGCLDGHGLLQRFSKDELMRHAIWLRELHSSGPWVDGYEASQGRCIKDITVIFDLQGLSMTRHYHPTVLAWFQSHMQMTDLYYPGPIKRIIVIRAPAVFRMIWSVVKHFFPQCSRDKMIFPSNHNYLEVLNKYMDADACLPPVIHPKGGRGKAALGMESLGLEAGRIPEAVGKGGKGYVPQVVAVAPLKPKEAVPLCGRQETSRTASSSSNSTRTHTTSSVDISGGEDETTNNHKDTSQRRNRKLTGRRSCVPKGEWEQICIPPMPDTSPSKRCVGRAQVAIIWHEPTGVEMTHLDFLMEHNMITI